MDVKSAASAYNSIANITQNMPTAAPPGNGPEAVGSSFSDLVSNALSNAVDTGNKAEEVGTLAMLGKADMVQLAIAVGNAEDALDTVVAVRDKVISAYQQIMQMSI